MIENKEIASSFNMLGKLMELHGENPFKIRSYSNAYNILRKHEQPLVDMTTEEIRAIHGLGEAIVGKIEELTSKGQMEALEKYKEMTPPGIIDMLNVRGFGPKKVSVIWNQLEIETIGELLQACQENRLVALKGFGLKTQHTLLKKLEYYSASRGFVHYATAENEVVEINELLLKEYQNDAAIVGDAAQDLQVIEGVDILVVEGREEELTTYIQSQGREEVEGLNWNGVPIHLIAIAGEEFAIEQFVRNSGESYAEYFQDEYDIDLQEFVDEVNEEAIFEAANVPFLSPGQRELFEDRPAGREESELIEVKDIKGVIHCHSTYSDGLHSLKDMALYAKEQGFEYMVITDHSQSAFYADGLKPDRILEQWTEIEKLNEEITDFHIFKGIESDILSDGSLDYEEEMLSGFDVVIASVHSNLNMDEEKATKRLLAAIENPHTRILGHPTGRLLLSREGYPIDHARVIDACAANNVIIELNSHPNRLDLDYHWISYCRDKNVKISINSDAHSKEGMHVIRHGVRVARKAWVTSQENLSSYSLEEFNQWVKK